MFRGEHLVAAIGGNQPIFHQGLSCFPRAEMVKTQYTPIPDIRLKAAASRPVTVRPFGVAPIAFLGADLEIVVGLLGTFEVLARTLRAPNEAVPLSEFAHCGEYRRQRQHDQH